MKDVLHIIFPHFSGIFRGVCKDIDHFPDDADYEQDAAEYLLRKLQMSMSPVTLTDHIVDKNALKILTFLS